MAVVNDSMVLIHLAKITLLEKSCDYFKEVFIPKKVFEEAVKTGKEKKAEDAMLIEEIINKGKIKVMPVKRKELIERANGFNIQGGEAEAVALYWEKKADKLICDDGNVRKKKELLEIEVIGTPAVILNMYKKRKITREKALNSIRKLKEIGWFNSSIIDFMLKEVL